MFALLLQIVIISAVLIYAVKLLNEFLSSNASKTGGLQGIGGWRQQTNQDVRCSSLRKKVLKRVDAATAQRLVKLAKLKNPQKSECWYWEKVIYDLERGR